jgi:hypothetical protein
VIARYCRHFGQKPIPLYSNILKKKVKVPPQTLLEQKRLKRKPSRQSRQQRKLKNLVV